MAVALALVRTGFGQSYTISTVAGTGWDLPGLSANLSNLEGVAVDGAGNVFMTLTTYSVVLRLDLSGQLSLVAGNGTFGFSGDGGPATLAQLSGPTAVAVDAAGNVYIQDTGNNRIRMVSNGVITTVAGGGTGGDGPATNAHLSFQNVGPGLTLDRAGNIYFADNVLGTRIRKLSNGVIGTLAGGGFSFSDNIPATAAFIDAQGVAVDSAGNIYFADYCAQRIRKVSNGTITSIAGNGQESFFFCAPGGSGPDTGKATSVPLDTPSAVAVDAAGNIYFTEGGVGPYRVRKVSNGNISTVAGGNSGLLSGPARGDNIPATSATLEFAANNAIAIDSAGNLYIPDEYWVVPPPGGVYRGDIEPAPQFGRLRKVSNGVITTIAGSADDGGSATGAQLNLPAGVAVDGAGNVYIADGNGIVREVSNGIINTIAGTRVGGGCGCDSGLPSGVTMNPTGIAVDSNENVFIASGAGLELSLASRTGPVVTPVATPSSPGNFIGVALDTAGNLYFADFMDSQIQELSNGVLTTIAGTGTQGYSGDNGPAASAQLSNPSGIAVDSAGNIYFADVGNQVIRKISKGVITTVAGNGTAGFSGDNGPATSAQLNLQSGAINCCLPVNPSPRLPGGIAMDGSGNLFISDSGNQRVRMVSNGTITTIAGTGNPGYSGDGGPAASAQLNNPSGIAVDTAGKVYVSDSSNGGIRVLSSDCSINVSPLSVTAPASGGSFPITIQANPSCSWSIAGLPIWITTLAIPSPSAGPVTTILVVAANTGASRSASVSIAGQPVLITQAAANVCTFNVSPSLVQLPPSGGTFTIAVQTAPFCSWAISGLPASGWIIPPPELPSLVGSASIVLTVAAAVSTGNIAHLVVAGQAITVTQGPAPGSGPVITSVTTAGSENPVIAPNTWVEIKGPFLGLPEDNRTWQNSDFVNNQMSTQLDSISVTMNGESAYVYYISFNQINVLTPPDLAPKPVQVVVTVSTVSSPPFTSQAQIESPSLFVLNGGPYIAAVHANGGLIGPTGLYPGLSTPAQPGETIELFANGFGPVPVVKGSLSQSGTLSPLPAIVIGGFPATVSFAGLVAPGEFQFNVAVPPGLANGDQVIVVTYGGQTTQPGTFITVNK